MLGAEVELWLAVVTIVLAMLSAAATFSFKAPIIGSVGAFFGSALVTLVVVFLYRQPIIGGGLDYASSFVPAPGVFEPPSGSSSSPLTIHLAPLAGSMGPLVAGLIVALLRRGANRSSARAVAAACGAVGMGLIAVALTVPRWSRPSPHHYLETLERVGGPVEQDRPFRIGASEFRLTGVRHSPIRSKLVPAYPRADGFAIDYACVLVGPRGMMPIGVPLHAEQGEETCLPVLLRVDPRGDYAVLYSACPDLCAYLPSVFSYADLHPLDQEIAAFAGTGGGQRYPLAMAFRVEDGTQVRLTPALMFDRLSAPRSFVYLALGGVLLPAALLVLAIRARRRRSALAEAADAMEGAAFVAALVLATPLVVAHALGL
jgi:hypothetical protein